VYDRSADLAASATFSPFQLNWTSHLGVVNGQRRAASLRCRSIPRNYSVDFPMNSSELQQPRAISLQNPISLRTKASASVCRIIGCQKPHVSNREQPSFAQRPNFATATAPSRLPTSNSDRSPLSAGVWSSGTRHFVRPGPGCLNPVTARSQIPSQRSWCCPPPMCRTNCLLCRGPSRLRDGLPDGRGKSAAQFLSILRSSSGLAQRPLRNRCCNLKGCFRSRSFRTDSLSRRGSARPQVEPLVCHL
jgi:hypothetical protein